MENRSSSTELIRTRISIAINEAAGRGLTHYGPETMSQIRPIVDRLWLGLSDQQRADLGWEGFLGLFWDEMIARADA